MIHFWQHGNISDQAPSSKIILRLDLGHALLQPGMASPKAETSGNGGGAVKGEAERTETGSKSAKYTHMTIIDVLPYMTTIKLMVFFLLTIFVQS